MAIFKVALIAVLAVAVAARPGDKDEKTSQPYEFEYEVSAAATPHSGGSSHQGHAEARVGDHSVGRYFVQLPEQGAHTRVSYTTDLWGFHPVVSYGSKQSSTRFAFGDRAIAALNANPGGPATINEPSTGSIAGNLPVSIDSAAKVGHADVSETLHTLAAAGNPPIPAQLERELNDAKFHLAAAQSAPPNPNRVPSMPPAPPSSGTPVAPVLATLRPVQQVQSSPPPPCISPSFIRPQFTNRPKFTSKARGASAGHPRAAEEGRPVVYTEFNSNNTSWPTSTLPIVVADLEHQVPVEVTKYVDRPVQVTKYVDRPVEVTKYVDRPVQVTKYVDRPVEVTKYVDRPVIKHVPVEKTVLVPGPTIEKHIPVPVTKVISVDRPVPHPVPHPVPYAQYVLNVPYQYGGAYGYGANYAGKIKSESYADAAYKLDGWRANVKNFNGLQTEAILKSGYGGASLRTESADLRGFKVSKTLLPAADYLPPVGPTKVTLTVEPHVHSVDSKGRTLCELQGSFKPPFVASKLLSTSYDDGTW
ncbi:Hypothetical predicted protein [Cloeon dipterum]|uniref:Uncharacterized protein n=1 Tax=Cloeon dipterum TaxID=197152 RepID=A0A8S1C4N6_9INSE|nr:Hypothetical predicted protein [Cloeon dipterum]